MGQFFANLCGSTEKRVPLLNEIKESKSEIIKLQSTNDVYITIGIDVGGTNTDSCFIQNNEDGLNIISWAKSPTTKDITTGIINSIKMAALKIQDEFTKKVCQKYVWLLGYMLYIYYRYYLLSMHKMNVY